MEFEPIKLITLEDYDREITKMENLLVKMDAFIKEHPERLGYAGNRKTLKIVHDIIVQEREEYVRELSDIYLHLNGKSIENGVIISKLNNLSRKFNEIENLLSKNYNDLTVKSITE
nr:hypothetical protein [uncultured Methanobrevibacter sp.]